MLQSCWFAPFFLKHSWNFQITVPFYILFWFPGSFPFPYDNHFSMEVSQTPIGSIVCPFLSSLIVFAHLSLRWSYALESFISKHLLPLPNEMVSEGLPIVVITCLPCYLPYPMEWEGCGHLPPLKQSFGRRQITFPHSQFPQLGIWNPGWKII